MVCIIKKEEQRGGERSRRQKRKEVKQRSREDCI
jgi:hypothetical protein